MTDVSRPSLGLVMGSAIAPERIAPAAAMAEASGFDEVWLAEDFFFTGGVSGAAGALAATEHLRVGLGVVSAVVRHPALLAMEVSTIGRANPGRLMAGIGLGVPAWVRQMRLLPASPVTALEECVTSVKRLLAGEELTFEGRVFSFDRIRLEYPDEGAAASIHMGVIGPNMLRLSGRVADGSVLSVLGSGAYIAWARRRIDEGRASVGRSDHHRITAFAIYSVSDDGAEARRHARGPVAFHLSHGRNALTDAYGISDEVEGLVADGSALIHGMPDAWVRDLTIAGTPAECAAGILAYHEAGADAVALFPVPSDEIDRIIQMTADDVLPLLR